VKEAICTAFLNHPNLVDEQISYHMFLYDAKRVIRHLSQRGRKENYQRVINLCTLALKNLNSPGHQTVIQIAQQALAEAQIELSFAKVQGFF
ncbi:type IV secretion protein Dot, partial [Acinetobacter baumannii]